MVDDHHDRDSFEVVPVAELSDEPVRRRRRRRSPRRVAMVVLVCALFATVSIGAGVTALHNRDKPSRGSVKTISRRQARINVLAALDASFAARTFNFDSVMSETAVAAVAGSQEAGMTLHAHGTINLDPLAMVATSNVGQYGEITSWVNSTTVWERGGGQYGMTGPDAGAGAPLSGFADLVESTLGAREGGVAMMSMASPTGYLNLAQQAITDTSSSGTGITSDGITVHEYDVTLDASQLVHRPAMSDEQISASTAAYALLHDQGYTNTTIRIGIDDGGFIHESASVVHFADGGSINATATFSDFGCAGAIAFPGSDTTTTTAPATCATAAPTSGATTLVVPTTAVSPTTEVMPTSLHAAGKYEGSLENALGAAGCDEQDHLDAIFTLEDTTRWKFRADYCMTLNVDLWNGVGTFTLADGAQLTGTFSDVEKDGPIPRWTHRLRITGGTQRFAGARGSCLIENSWQNTGAVIVEYGPLTCDIEI